MKIFITVKNTCPHCKEEIEVDVLSHEKVLIECPACNVLMEVENGEFKETNYKFDKPKSLRVSDIHEILDCYEESLRLNDPLTELLILGDCEKIIAWYRDSEQTEELEDWKENVLIPKLAEYDMFDCINKFKN